MCIRDRAGGFNPKLNAKKKYELLLRIAEKQFAGLRPADREKHRSQSLPENFEFLLEQAVQLRRDVYKRQQRHTTVTTLFDTLLLSFTKCVC